MENERSKPIDAEVSKTKAFGGGLGDYTNEKLETQKAVKAAEKIIRGQKAENPLLRLIHKLQGK